MSNLKVSGLPKDAAGVEKAQSPWHALLSSVDLLQAQNISRHKYAGGLIVFIRAKLMRLLGPLLAQQVRYNSANLQVVSELTAEVRALSQAYAELRAAHAAEPSVAALPPLPSAAGAAYTLGGGLSDPRWQPAIWPNWDDLVPPRDLWVGPSDPLSHFMRWIWEYRAYLSLLCGLREDSAVLEIGCNHGRTAMGLLDFVRPPGRYEGLDILPKQIEFAQRHIQAAYPHFRFTLANIFNAAYNPAGQISAAEYRFPYEDASFDIAYAASVFTHLLPADAAQYLKESRRVLRPDGTCCYSFLCSTSIVALAPRAASCMSSITSIRPAYLCTTQPFQSM